ncbi:MAG: PIN domain-containing protein [Armatimonadetes bacterium]|nr:PIN domain-containing protein [Armatimonadota bacterium]
MILTDTGPFVAIMDRGDPHHARCAEALRALTPPLVTTLPVLTEAMHLLGRRQGWRAQQALAGLVRSGKVEVVTLVQPELLRAFDLMDRYQDTPMSFADASLVALAEHLGLRQVFTLDSGFCVFRFHGRGAFHLVPAPKRA